MILANSLDAALNRYALQQLADHDFLKYLPEKSKDFDWVGYLRRAAIKFGLQGYGVDVEDVVAANFTSIFFQTPTGKPGKIFGYDPERNDDITQYYRLLIRSLLSKDLARAKKSPPDLSLDAPQDEDAGTNHGQLIPARDERDEVEGEFIDGLRRSLKGRPAVLGVFEQVLRDPHVTQVELSREMGVSPQYVGFLYRELRDRIREYVDAHPEYSDYAASFVRAASARRAFWSGVVRCLSR